MNLVFQKRKMSVRGGRNVTEPFAVLSKTGNALRFNTIATKTMVEKHVTAVEVAIDSDEGPHYRSVYLKLCRPGDKSVFDQSYSLHVHEAKKLSAPHSTITGKGLLADCGFAPQDKFEFSLFSQGKQEFAKLTRI